MEEEEEEEEEEFCGDCSRATAVDMVATHGAAVDECGVKRARSNDRNEEAYMVLPVFEDEATLTH